MSAFFSALNTSRKVPRMLLNTHQAISLALRSFFQPVFPFHVFGGLYFTIPVCSSSLLVKSAILLQSLS
jgi:hypothetical protein